MRRAFAISGGLSLLLIISLAFNVGFGSTLAVRKVREMCGGPCSSAGAGVTLCCEPHLFDSIELTSEQSRQFAAAQDAMMVDLSALCGEMAMERARLGELLTTDRPDETAIAGQIDRISALQRRVQARVVTHLLDQRQHLTPAQRTQYDELIKQRICPCDGAADGKSCPPHGERCGTGGISTGGNPTGRNSTGDGPINP